MSRLLKFFVHLVVICTIVCVLGLALPPFFGVNTVIMDSADKVTTNLPLGSVTYAIPEKASEIEMGTPILVQEDSKTYRYNIASLNLENGTGTVVDPSVTNGEPITVAVREYVPKVVVTIGYVGYLLIATRSVEGLIILGLALLFLIILYVIAELWKRDPDDDDEDLEDTPAGYVKSEKELKKEEKIRARRMKEEEREIRQQSRQDKREKKERKRLVRTGGFVDEIEEEDEDEFDVRPVEMQNAAASEAHAVLKKEIAAATADDQPAAVFENASSVGQETINIFNEIRRRQEEPEPVQPELPEEEPETEEPVVYKKLAMPVMTAQQLAERAKAQGDAPHIEKDAITKVTFLDYSGIIAGEDFEEEE